MEYCIDTCLNSRIITQLPSLVDPFDLVCEETDPKVSKPSGTCDNANNSYTDPKVAQASPDGKRIDHILFHVSPSWRVRYIFLNKVQIH